MQWARILSVALFAALALCLMSAPAVTIAATSGRYETPQELDPAFCEPTELVNDFGLSSLPPTHEVPLEGDLPFGPKTVTLDPLGPRVLTPGGEVGFRLSSRNYGGHTPLHWVLRDRLRALDSTGVPGPVLSNGRERVRLINSAREVGLFLRPPEALGFYQYEIEISGFDGKRLAVYDSDLRVERKYWDVRLGLDRTVFHPGNHVLSRVENYGTVDTSLGDVFHLQRATANGWEHVSYPGEGSSLLVLFWLYPGGPGPCDSLPLAADFKPGEYRIVKEVERGGYHGRPRIYRLTAPFTVVPVGS